MTVLIFWDVDCVCFAVLIGGESRHEIGYLLGMCRQLISRLLTSMAQLDAYATEDQEIACLIPGGSGSILSWKQIMKYFLWSLISLPQIQERQLSVSGETMCISTC